MINAFTAREIECDGGCGEGMLYLDDERAVDIRRIQAAIGWSSDNRGHDYCPNCSDALHGKG